VSRSGTAAQQHDVEMVHSAQQQMLDPHPSAGTATGCTLEAPLAGRAAGWHGQARSAGPRIEAAVPCARRAIVQIRRSAAKACDLSCVLQSGREPTGEPLR
jgi:hypothetical protein